MIFFLFFYKRKKFLKIRKHKIKQKKGRNRGDYDDNVRKLTNQVKNEEKEKIFMREKIGSTTKKRKP